MTAPTPAAITAERLAELEQLRAGATEGPWVARGSHIEPGPSDDGPALMARTNSPADAALIVAAVTALPDLIAEVREASRLRAVVERVQTLAVDLSVALDQRDPDLVAELADQLTSALAGRA